MIISERTKIYRLAEIGMFGMGTLRVCVVEWHMMREMVVLWYFRVNEILSWESRVKMGGLKSQLGSSHCGSVGMNSASIPEDVGLVSDLAQ